MRPEPAEIIKQARAKLNLTQQELAEELGIGRLTVLRYENGSAVPEMALLAIEQLVARQQKPKRSKR